jgi:uncharacterized protein YneF (UPF0154 family)
MLEVLSVLVGLIFGAVMSLGLTTLIMKKNAPENKIRVFVEKNGRHYKKIPKNLFIL